MGYLEISLNLPTDYTGDQLRQKISQELDITEFSYQIENKSLDSRKKNNIHWLLRISVLSEEIKGEAPLVSQSLNIPYQKRKEKVVVVGSGPAGFFSAFVLQKAGFHTTLVERGSEVNKRAEGIREFERTGVFNPACNYAFGEGGAGTFSDGKLTSRSKHISKERQFVLSSYINAGAPEEIAYMAHPHLGSDNLKKIVRNLREEFLNVGGSVLFDTLLEDLRIKDDKVAEAVTSSGRIEADYFIIAPGHSAYETYRMLIGRKVKFRTKSFAIGSRVEHSQEIINKAQWGRTSLPGVKAAEYRLTAYANTNIVNGMSRYKRNGKFANAACVAGVHPDMLIGRESSPQEALDWVEALEQSFYRYAGGFQAPFSGIRDFIDRKEVSGIVETSYPFGLKPADLWDLLPFDVSSSIKEGLKDFSKKVRGFETGIIMGLESKTSSPIQAVREGNGLCTGFENLYMAGEGSGCAGGIISSAADGIKAAMHIIDGNNG